MAPATLTSGTLVSGLNGYQGSVRHFQISVPSGASELRIERTGSTNADIYVGRTAYPTASSHQYAGSSGAATETIVVPNPSGGTYYIAVVGGSSYSNAAIRATVAQPPVAQLVSFTPSATSVVAGTPVTLTLVGRNAGAGPANAAGYMSIAFPQLTGASDGAQVTAVTATNGVTPYERAAGEPIVAVGGRR